MKTALFIGGTGTISTAITAKVATSPEWKLYILNRGSHKDEIPEGVTLLQEDINDIPAVEKELDGMTFDCVCDFIGFVPEQVERDWRIFAGRTKQYMYISSASAYQKPCANFLINETTPLANPYWQYSRDKIACEEFLMHKYRETGYPVTIIRPSHTYGDRSVPVAIHGAKGSWQVLQRMLQGKKVIVHGDGLSLWTLTHNSDFAKAFVGLMGNPHAIGGAFQITSDESLTWNQILGIVADAIGAEYKPFYLPSTVLAEEGKQYDLRGNLLGDKAYSVVFDCSKVKRAVPEFQATTRFDQGVRKTLAYIMAHPECQVPDPEFDRWCDELIAKYSI